MVLAKLGLSGERGALEVAAVLLDAAHAPARKVLPLRVAQVVRGGDLRHGRRGRAVTVDMVVVVWHGSMRPGVVARQVRVVEVYTGRHQGVSCNVFHCAQIYLSSAEIG